MGSVKQHRATEARPRRPSACWAGSQPPGASWVLGRHPKVEPRLPHRAWNGAASSVICRETNNALRALIAFRPVQTCFCSPAHKELWEVARSNHVTLQSVGARKGLGASERKASRSEVDLSV